MKRILLSLLILFLFSCKKNEEKDESKITNQKAQDTVKVETGNNDIAKPDTLKINYLEHKNLLNILTLVPDSSMGSWEWKKEDRIEYVKKYNKTIIHSHQEIIFPVLHLYNLTRCTLELLTEAGFCLSIK